MNGSKGEFEKHLTVLSSPCKLRSYEPAHGSTLGVMMAIIQCKECGHDVSSKAFSCPNCGNPVAVTENVVSTPTRTDALEDRLWGEKKKNTMQGPLRWSVVLAVVAVIVFFAGQMGFFSILGEWVSAKQNEEVKPNSGSLMQGLKEFITPMEAGGLNEYNEALKLIGTGTIENYHLAEQRLKVALQKNPELGEAHLNLGYIYLQQGWWDGAERETNEAIRLLRFVGQTIIVGNTIDQTLAIAYNNLGVIEMGRAAEFIEANELSSARAHWERGMDHFRAAINTDWECSQAHMNINTYGLAFDVP